MIALTSNLPLWALSQVISGISPTVGGIVNAFGFYLGPLVMGYRLIRYQQQLAAE